MAATWIKPRHASSAGIMPAVLKELIDYINNPKKTNEGRLVTCYGCAPDTAVEDFMLPRGEYHNQNGRKGMKRDIAAYHIRQSFKPGEITPEQANEIGVKLIEALTKLGHQFIVSTHTDNPHIHNHIVFNPITTDGSGKFRNPKKSIEIIQRISDLLCAEYGMSVIVSKSDKKKQSYNEWQKGKNAARDMQHRIRELIDISNSPKAQDSPGYARWARTFNLKEAAKTLLYLQENNLTDRAVLEEKTHAAVDKFNGLSARLKETEAKMKQVEELQTHLRNYGRTRELYHQYRALPPKEKEAFFEAHRAEIASHEAAKRAFDTLGLKKLPKHADTAAEWTALKKEQHLLYKEYYAEKKTMRELLTAKNNINLYLGTNETGTGGKTSEKQPGKRSEKGKRRG
jgi:hypothetical protein